MPAALECAGIQASPERAMSVYCTAGCGSFTHCWPLKKAMTRISTIETDFLPKLYFGGSDGVIIK